MNDHVFPPFVRSLPRAEVQYEGLSAWTLKGQEAVVVFMQVDEDVAIPRHQHGPQWGVVLAGTMTLTIGNDTRTYGPGETHYIPGGVEHEATLHAGWRGIYVFPRPAS